MCERLERVPQLSIRRELPKQAHEPATLAILCANIRCLDVKYNIRYLFATKKLTKTGDRRKVPYFPKYGKALTLARQEPERRFLAWRLEELK